jgi:23S rRNA (adenine2503-C2)-methyltransferase
MHTNEFGRRSPTQPDRFTGRRLTDVCLGIVHDVTSDPIRTRYGINRADLAELLDDEPAYRVDQVWQGLYTQLADPGDITNVGKALRSRLEASLPTELTPVTESVSDAGDTVKFLWELDGGSRIETVLMLYPDRATVCVSSQAGCAMGCGFCATGQAGFTRHLTVGEIVEQVVRAAQRTKESNRRVSNVVFMGMGEPMANLDAVWGAVERIHGDLGLSARHITISTVGLVPGIRSLKSLPLPVNLAVSLHAANDRLRDELVPINRRYPIGDLLDACADYLRVKNRRVSFEWAMIDGVNDRDVDARELAVLCRRLRPSAHVNLIPLNPTPGYPTRGTPLRRVHEFRDMLDDLGVNATVRRNRGTDIDAACGQLAAGQPVTVGVEPPSTSGGSR